MTTFLFDENFTPGEKAILEKCAKNHAKELGILNSDCTVTMRRDKVETPSTVAAMTQLEAGHFLFILNESYFNLYDAISAIGHELVHVHQYLRGHMKEVFNATYWKGHFIPKVICESAICYDKLPWEVEAFELQPKLLHAALKNLRPREKLIVAMSAAAAKEKKIATIWKNTDS